MSTATLAVGSPAVNHKFAVRRHIKIVAIVCECGATSHGPGVKKWKQCPRFGVPVIRSNDQRYRDRHPFLDVDQRIYDHYQASSGPEVRR